MKDHPNTLLNGLVTVYDSIRVDRTVAKQWLLENKGHVLGGRVWYLGIMDLGLGVCEVRLRPYIKRNTLVVKEWEKHS